MEDYLPPCLGQKCCACFETISVLAGSALAAQQEEVIRWSAPRSATYDKIPPYTLNWSGDVLDRGGLVLSTLEVTASSA